MKINYSNKLNAYYTTAAAVTALPANVAKIHTLAQVQARREGVANAKAYALEALGDVAFEVGATVHAYAVVAGELALEGRVDFSRSLIVRGRASSVLARTRDILAAATEQLTNLADYGVTQEQLTDFEAKINAFDAAHTKPRQQVTKASVATRSLEVRFRATDTILKQRLDKLVVGFKASAPAFYKNYQAARTIVDLTGSRPPAPSPARRRNRPEASAGRPRPGWSANIDSATRGDVPCPDLAIGASPREGRP